jgi:tRNA modification GTPase
MMQNTHDTIIALATGIDRGSIAIIRLSGSDSIDMVNRCFSGKNLTSADGNTIHLGNIHSEGQILDQVLVSVFRSPHSYTGENSIEISCHANPLIIDSIITTLAEQGARLARPGEFTFRSFMNGKMSLSQAEAVADLISTKSNQGLRNSLRQLNGELNIKLDQLKEEITEIRSVLEALLDFPEEEDITGISEDKISERLAALSLNIKHLSDSYNQAKILGGSITVTIIGKTNVGKSTLMNALLGEDRVITSHIPGTTRDIVHEEIIIDDIHFKLIDTAGLRDTIDDIERKGIEKTRAKIAISDILLWVIDNREPWSPRLFEYIKSIIVNSTRKIIIVINKCDLKTNPQIMKMINRTGLSSVKTSALYSTGIKKLKKTIIEKIITESNLISTDLIITNLRQKKVLDDLLVHVDNAKKIIRNQRGYEFACVDLRQASETIGEITGETATEDILERIFSTFCIGK